MNSSEFRLSFEFFPPRTEAGKEKLVHVRNQLHQLSPEFFSMTYGAGGSTRNNTKALVIEYNEAGFPTVPHLSFGGDTEETIIALINAYKNSGVNRIVALRGDMPSGMGSASQMVYANQLVAFIRKHFGNDFHLEVAAYPEIHPESASYTTDVHYLKGKFDAGADSAITQYFFNLDAYCFFVDQCQRAGITQPIYPGIMPIIKMQNLVRFSETCGAEIPRWLCKAIEAYGDNQESMMAFGIDVVTELCEGLIDQGIPGLHFYTMNQIEPVKSIIDNLGLSSRAFK
ncbi:methylenetetrahydrofolate reductase [NAD(P)H] [Candidatus Endobugula sertula]|uniref:Methylenetetrahydrofolate reductase n=1 Tax=Candidatus Endobugula sertula TaxID=62101 RepID=A0A1D2QPK6_9GAMM|nr:methylenetetrahydrofolate reductase [NAD(P)H] [Candidatus Endobugula sertula]